MAEARPEDYDKVIDSIDKRFYEATKPLTENPIVNNPPHYTRGSIECIDAIRAALTDEEWRGYCKGNMIKYVWRERYKGGDVDLDKAETYKRFATEKRHK